jgi:hypothetical protein
MVATSVIKVYTTASLAVEETALNANFLSADTHSADPASDNPINVPDAGSSYSYERVLAMDFSGSFNSIDNILAWKSGGSFSDGALAIKASVETSVFTPVNTASPRATVDIPTSEGSALDLSQASPITVPGISKYLDMQLVVPTAVVTLGTIGTQQFTIQYDES